MSCYILIPEKAGLHSQLPWTVLDGSRASYPAECAGSAITELPLQDMQMPGDAVRLFSVSLGPAAYPHSSTGRYVTRPLNTTIHSRDLLLPRRQPFTARAASHSIAHCTALGMAGCVRGHPALRTPCEMIAASLGVEVGLNLVRGAAARKSWRNPGMEEWA